MAEFALGIQVEFVAGGLYCFTGRILRDWLYHENCPPGASP